MARRKNLGLFSLQKSFRMFQYHPFQEDGDSDGDDDEKQRRKLLPFIRILH